MPTYNEDEDAYLKHYGIKRKSGRYPWGSGGHSTSLEGQALRSRDFFGMVADLEAQGLTRAQVAQGLGMTTTQLRDTTTIAKNAVRREKQHKAEKLREKGWSATEIGKQFDPPLNESSVRDLLNKSTQERTQILDNTVDFLRAEVDKGGWIDLGAGQEYYVPGGGISKEKLRAAVSVLKDEGYVEFNKIQVPQVGTGGNQKTTFKVLTPPGTTYPDVMRSTEKIRGLTMVSEDHGRSVFGLLPPLSIKDSRVGVNYKEDGGAEADGVIYVRRGVKDVEIGGSAYAQVRIDINGTHYLKGMAMYKDDMPDGVDLLFNTNKSKTDPKVLKDGKLGAMKPQSEDKDNPFGANVSRQITALDKNGKEYTTSAMNILAEEGKWDTWSRNLSSQVLSKQSPRLAKQLLDKTYDKKKRELDEILALTNPTVREKLLKSFADSADSDAVTLSAGGLKRSSYHVILPFSSLKDNEVYAPNFEQGERVALIRYPHGGTFEIPVLTVNNNAKAPQAAIGRAKDAVGINSRVAERLSGADFDGDFVMVIPNNSGTIKATPGLRQLDGFDPHVYRLPEDAPRMSARTKGKQMGDVSNLITDMTIKKAPMDEISRAVRHSMVVIDAEKHHLDYKRSAEDFGIAALKQKYQGRADAGAATLVSRATSQQRVDARRASRSDEGGPIDKDTGKLRYTPTGEQRVEGRRLKDGTFVPKLNPDGTPKMRTVQQVSTKLAETDDAHTLVSKDGGTLIERVYADHSNQMKALANASRKELVNNTEGIVQSKSAKQVYAKEVQKLKSDLDVALMNSPRERRAQVVANAIIAQKRAANPEMDDATLKKVKSQSLKEARLRTGADKQQIEIEPRQWDAIQAGAVSKTMLRRILENTDIEKVKELATPRQALKVEGPELARARALAAAGKTQAEIATVLGVSLTTLKRGLADG